MRKSGLLAIVVVSAVLLAGTAQARPPWKRRIDRLAAGHSIGISVAEDGKVLYRHTDKSRRVPASNQKLLLSMTAFDLIGPNERIVTRVRADRLDGGTVRGDLWLLGRGDPTITGGGAFGKSLPFGPSRLSTLVRRIKAAGIHRVTGSVMGSTGYFTRDWYAPGWKSFFPAYYVALPTALAFEGNTYNGRHISNPEWRAARSLTRRLRAKGVRVGGNPGAGVPPQGGTVVAEVKSQPLAKLLGYTNKQSSNFFAEMIGKRLGAVAGKPPGSIAKGAAAIARWTARHGVEAIARDSSGLSYENRVSPRGLVHLLDVAESTTWGKTFRESLPVPGQGTLEDRLAGVKVRAKTGTLDGVSALSGWVRLDDTGTWAEFSILSSGMPKSQAVDIEDRVVRILEAAAGKRQGDRTTGTLTTWSGEPSWADDSYTSTNPSVSAATWNGTFLL
jgi:D-alanyl-D-alanine carboxypeptidase/D-alanyl-D-alanine-endopeptidase (penicillin-binding protein 4)